MSLQEQELKNIFVDRTGILSAGEFAKIVKIAADMRRPLAQELIEQSLVSSRYFLGLLGEYFGLPVTELKIADIDPMALKAVSETFATERLVVPFAKEGDTLKVAVADPRDEELAPLVERTTHCKVSLSIATEQAIKRALVLYRGSIREALETAVGHVVTEGEKTQAALAHDSPPVVSLLDACIDAAVLVEASDMHLEPFENEILVRFRVDGLLRTVATLPRNFLEGLIARLKVLASLRIDEHRLPQDGRFSARVKQQAIDVRLSIVPSFWGEKAVLRMLPKETRLFDLASLGLLESDLALVAKHLERPYGMVLVCGPTGSGKTTTAYACLQHIGVDRIDVVNISTIEDPIEYTMPRVTQIQIQPSIDLTFATGLRSLLRQDPDVILVGEIRDNDTADIAARASLIGRLLLASLHTNDAIGAVPRLLDMGVEPYIISATLTLVLAQRLVRKLCVRCRESYAPTEETLQLVYTHAAEAYLASALQKAGVLGAERDALRHVRFFRAKGCAQCDHTGYQGRTAVFEVLEMSDALRSAVATRSDIVALREIAKREGAKTLFLDGVAKAMLGITDLAEVMRATL